MDYHAADGRDSVVDRDLYVGVKERACVADLTARFRVERRAVQDDLAVFAFT